MGRQLDDRYPGIRSFAKHRGRETSLARDRLTNRLVVVKKGEITRACREAQCLLAMPRNVVPGVLDLVYQGPGQLLIVLEYLPGRTLAEAASDILSTQVPELAWGICGALAQVHRLGWIHGDINPHNVVILDGDGGVDDGVRVRLLDFGFAIHRYGSTEPGERGGMPPFLAPEIRKGWIVDGRADLYSLGVMIGDQFPLVRENPGWAPILERLAAPIPAHRYPDAAAARDELSEVFSLAHGPVDGDPSFGCGPFRGRDADLERLKVLLRDDPSARVLVQARPGVGLSRFLLESVLRNARADGPPVRVVDLTDLDGSEVENALTFLKGPARDHGAIVCGIGDPSVGLCWSPQALRVGLQSVASAPEWTRFPLLALGQDSLVELVAAGLGPRSDVGTDLAMELHARSEGDLNTAADGFLRVVRAAGTADGLSWALDSARLESVLAEWNPAAPLPRLQQAAPPLREALQLCAQAGSEFPVALARELLARFSKTELLDALCEHGYLQEHEIGQLSFVTASLWYESRLSFGEPERAVDVWLLEQYPPDADRAEHVLQACARARRLGDALRETDYLSKGLGRALDQVRFHDLFRLLAYPAPPPRNWSEEFAREAVERLAGILGPDWTPQRLLLAATLSARAFRPRAEISLLEEVATGPDPLAAVRALVSIGQRLIMHPGEGDWRAYREKLVSLQGVAGGITPGLVDFLDAYEAMLAGQMDQALEVAERAYQRLKGSGLSYEESCLEMMAAARSESDPDAAISLMKSAILATEKPQRLAAMYSNLNIMYSRERRFDLAEECLEAGIRRVRGRVARQSIIQLRVLRAGIWMETDRYEPALEEMLALLSSIPRLQARFRVPLQINLSTCHLRRGAASAAIREATVAWEDADRNAPPAMRWQILTCLLDLVIDLEAWSLMQAQRESALRILPDEGALSQTTMARTRAVLAQMDRRLSEAATILEENRSFARELPLNDAWPRYLHHLGRVRLAQSRRRHNIAAAERAADLFREELEQLPQQGLGYYRTMALFSLGEARRAAGDLEGSLVSLDQAIVLAREIQNREVLARCLRERARMVMEK